MENEPRQSAAWRTVIGLVIVLALAVAAFFAGRYTRSVWKPAPMAAVVPNTPTPATVLASASEKREILNTYVTLTVVAPDEATAQQHVADGFALMEHYQQILNAHAEDSELSKINAAAGKAPVKVSSELFDAVQAGVYWYGRTRGVFDITVLPLVMLWRKCGQENRLPTDAELAEVRKLLGADRIELNAKEKTVRLPVEGMRLDLGGLGKGYVVDQVAKFYRSRGVTAALIAGSGDICVMGRQPNGEMWSLGIQDPRDPEDASAILGVVQFENMSISTSGNYQRYVTIQGKRHSHIVDPRTGQTADAVPSVTVIGPNTLTTDILDTALSVLGVKDGLELLKSLPDCEAEFILLDEKDEPQFIPSPGFGKYVVK